MFLGLPRLTNSPKRKGLTLIELTITIGVIVILAGVIFLALDPVARLQEARYSTALQDAGEITKAIHLFANDLQKEPGNTDETDELAIPNEGRMSRMNICMPGIKGNIVPDYCVNLDELVEEGLLPEMPIYDEPDGRMPNVTGFSVYAHGGFWEVLPGQVFVPRSIEFDGVNDYVFTDIPSDYKGLDLDGPGAISMWVKSTGDQNEFAGLIMKTKPGAPASDMNYHIHSNVFAASTDVGCPVGVTCGSIPQCPNSSITDGWTQTPSCIPNDPIRVGYCDLVGNDVSAGRCLPANNGSSENAQTRYGIHSGKWQLIVFTWNSEKKAVYQFVENGASYIKTETEREHLGGGTNMPKPLPGDDLFIGARIPNNSHFKGLIDDVRIYDRYLNLNEIQTMLNDTLEDDPISSLKQQYMFNDNPLQTIVRSDYDRQKANAIRTYKSGAGDNLPPEPEKEISPPWRHILRGCDQDATEPCS